MTATPPQGFGPAVFVGPAGSPAMSEAVLEGGGRVVEDSGDADAVVWVDKGVEALRRHLRRGVRWVQLPDAGIEPWLAAGLVTADRVFTSARGCYGRQVAEHAMALLLAVARRLPECAALTSWPSADRPWGRSLRGAVVTVVGAGDIGTSLIALLEPFGAEVLAVTRSGRPVPGAATSYGVADLEVALRSADFVVLAAPSTSATVGLLSADRLAAMRDDAWLLNVGRGDVVDTDALVEALSAGRLAGAALDVTDPEPLPAGHPLWSMPQVLVTPHVANPPALKAASLAARVRENTRRFGQGRPLLGVVDPESGH